jgi:UDP-N-acetylglucosamine 2-epimerase
MKICGAVVGNSSSGLLEAPAFGVPTVDIGIRQKGRFKPDSVIESEDDFESIERALTKSLSDSHRRASTDVKHPYGDGHVSEKIIEILKSVDFDSLMVKKFYDVKF